MLYTEDGLRDKCPKDDLRPFYLLKDELTFESDCLL